MKELLELLQVLQVINQGIDVSQFAYKVGSAIRRYAERRKKK